MREVLPKEGESIYPRRFDLLIVDQSLPPKNSWNRSVAQRWWQFGAERVGLYEAITGRDRVLVRSRVSNINSIAFVPTGIVMSEATVVFNFDDYASFALLQAMAHTEWLTHHSSSMRNDVRYTVS